MMSETVQWLTLHQLAERWNVSYDTIRRRVASGDVPIHKLTRRIPLSAVEQIEADVVRERARGAKKLRRVLAQAGKDHYEGC